MLATSTGGSCLERPSLSRTFETFCDSAGVDPGLSDFDGGDNSGVVVVLSRGSECLSVTQYITNAFTITCKVPVSGASQIH